MNLIQPLAVGALMAVCLAGQGWAARIDAGNSSDANAPLKVTSDQMLTDKKNRKIVFSGAVVAVKGRLRIKTDEMTVWTDDEQREFQKIVARGSVQITKDDKTATGENAEYFNENKKSGQAERIEITGNAHMRDGKNSASGSKVIYYFKTEDMKLSGDSSRPSSITFFPGEGGAMAPAPESPMSETPAPETPAPEKKVSAKPSVEEFPVVMGRPTVSSEKGSGLRYMIQAASFPNENDAQSMAAKLRKRGFSPQVVEASVKGAPWYRVRVGEYHSYEEAENAAERMREEMRLKPMIIQSRD
ncbi:MAG: lipopolysaccharide transport periplasmic protein LptA [Nitrospinota bacterium]|nr:lipopolysaccharide transport periplasmic protein LptA [Nitrospinota bacterium]